MGDRTSPHGAREFDLDPFRGLVCLWLMGLHLCYMSEAHPALLRLVGPTAAEILYNARLGVESFLVLAGFMMAHMLRPAPGEGVRLAAYFARRCCRLLLPFWLAVLLAAADKWAAYALLGGGRGRPDLAGVASQLLLVNEFFGVPEPAVGYWSMATLELFYVLWLAGFALVWRAMPAGPNAYRTAVARMGPVGLAVFFASAAAYFRLGPEAVHLFRYAFFIVLGVLLYGHARLGLYRWELRLAVVALAATTVGFQNSRPVAALVTAGVLYALARGARFPQGPLFGALRFVGARAYSVYLIHAIVGLRLLGGFRLVAPYGDWVAVPLVLAGAAASLAGAEGFHRLVERPCQRLARRVRYRAAGPAPSGESPLGASRPLPPFPQPHPDLTCQATR